MPNRIAPRLPPLDLRKKKGKVPPHSKHMPHPGLKDNIALRPIPYNWSWYFTRDSAKKTIALKTNTKFDKNAPCSFILKTCTKTLIMLPLQSMIRKTPSIICTWWRSCIQPSFIDSIIVICASWGKREITSSINNSFMILLLFTLDLSSTCTSTQKLLWETQL